MARPPISRSVEMRIVREVDLYAAIRKDCKATIALPLRPIVRLIKIGMLWNNNCLADVFALELAPLTCPWLPVSGSVQKGVLGNGNCNASVAVDLVTPITQPDRPIRVVCQICVWGQIDPQAEVVNLQVATKATPALSRRIKISAIGHDDLKTSRVIDLLKPVQALPACAIGSVRRIGVLQNEDGKTVISVTPVPAITLPSLAIAFGCAFAGIGAA